MNCERNPVSSEKPGFFAGATMLFDPFKRKHWLGGFQLMGDRMHVAVQSA
jgi:hypothetical protein